MLLGIKYFNDEVNSYDQSVLKRLTYQSYSTF